MNEGRDASIRANSVPKSVSAETMIRSSSKPSQERLRHWTIASRSRMCGPRHGRPATTAAQAAAEVRYPPGISHRLRQGKFTFQGGSCRITQALPNVIAAEIGIFSQDFLFRPTASKEPKDGGDRNAKAPNARNSAHLRRIDGNELKVLQVASVFIVAGGGIPHKVAVQRAATDEYIRQPSQSRALYQTAREALS